MKRYTSHSSTGTASPPTSSSPPPAAALSASGPASTSISAGGASGAAATCRSASALSSESGRQPSTALIATRFIFFRAPAVCRIAREKNRGSFVVTERSISSSDDLHESRTISSGRSSGFFSSSLASPSPSFASAPSPSTSMSSLASFLPPGLSSITIRARRRSKPNRRCGAGQPPGPSPAAPLGRWSRSTLLCRLAQRPQREFGSVYSPLLNPR